MLDPCRDEGPAVPDELSEKREIGMGLRRLYDVLKGDAEEGKYEDCDDYVEYQSQHSSKYSLYPSAADTRILRDMPRTAPLTDVQKQVRRALTHFKAVDPILFMAAIPFRASLHTRLSTGSSETELFSALCRSVIGQQLSTKAAQSIWSRILEKFEGAVTPQKILRARATTLRLLGLSEAKVKTLKALAGEVSSGDLVLGSLLYSSPEEAIARLSRIWGIGPWTAQMFLMFSLGAPDIFSPGDLGLVRAMESLYELPEGYTSADLKRLSDVWSPHRSVACLVLWAHRDAGTRTA